MVCAPSRRSGRQADCSKGVATLNADGSFTYTPDLGFTGTDSFTYTLTDAGLDGNFATVGDNLIGTGTGQSVHLDCRVQCRQRRRWKPPSYLLRSL
jgi:hypothetical protein